MNIPESIRLKIAPLGEVQRVMVGAAAGALPGSLLLLGCFRGVAVVESGVLVRVALWHQVLYSRWDAGSRCFYLVWTSPKLPTLQVKVADSNLTQVRPFLDLISVRLREVIVSTVKEPCKLEAVDNGLIDKGDGSSVGGDAQVVGDGDGVAAARGGVIYRGEVIAQLRRHLDGTYFTTVFVRSNSSTADGVQLPGVLDVREYQEVLVRKYRDRLLQQLRKP